MGRVKSSNVSIKTKTGSIQKALKVATPIQSKKTPPRQMPMGRKVGR